MTKRKPKNWELEQGIHNPPDAFYYRYKHIVIYADNLFEPPTVSTHHVARHEDIVKVKKWLDLSKIPYDTQKVNPVIKVKQYPKKGMDEKTLQRYEKNSTSYENGIFTIKTYSSPGRSELLEWVDVIKPLIHIFELSESERKELFQDYRETMIAKHTIALTSIEKARKYINKAMLILWNERLSEYYLLDELKNSLESSYKRYEKQLETFKETHKKTGKHKFLYPLLQPLVDKLRKSGISDYRMTKEEVDSETNPEDALRILKNLKNPNPLTILFLLFHYESYSLKAIFKYIK